MVWLELNVDTAVPFLLEAGLISAADIVGGELRISGAWRRNRNLRVECRGRAGYLLKQPDSVEAGGRHTLNVEADFYQLCRETGAAAELAAFLPHLRHYEPGGPRLVLELLAGVRTLGDEYEAHDAASFASATPVAHSLGRVLATVHTCFRAPGLAEHPFIAGLAVAPPWILSAHRPSQEMLARITAAHRQTLRILQTEEGLSDRLAKLAELWRPDTLVHGDVRADNVLLRPGVTAGEPELFLVDWEMAQWGDPAWDVGGVLHDFMHFWIVHMPQDTDLSAAERVARATYPLAALQLAVRAFWRAYQRTARVPSAQAAPFVLKAVAFSAARLVQSAFEGAQSGDHMTAASVLMLQVAANALASPVAAAGQLYGLLQPEEGGS